MRLFQFFTDSLLSFFLLTSLAAAQNGNRLRQWMEQRQAGEQTKSSQSFEGRDYEIHIPKNLPPAGSRSMVVALHGCTGWAAQFENHIGLDEAADKNHFIVLYLNGTQASEKLSERRRAWNAGTCCGMPARKKIDDVDYIIRATEQIARENGVNMRNIFVTGHSNGAMMSARLMCERNFFKSAVLISGALNVTDTSCPGAAGKHLLAIHGTNDENYPPQGGPGPKSIAGTNFVSQETSKSLFEKAGADYTILMVQGAEHKPDTINAALLKQTGQSLPDTIVHHFGLDH